MKSGSISSVVSVPSVSRLGRADAWAMGLLGVVVLLFLLPALALRAPVLHSDGANEDLPRAMAAARALQQGALPLWNFNTFAGAKPFYIANEIPCRYLPMLPFYLLARADDATQAWFVLGLLPFTLHVLWAAAGGYLFGRLVLGLHPAGAFTLGLMYSLCPEMVFQLLTTEGSFLFSYLPWVMLAVARFLDSGRTAWWCVGTAALALLGAAAADNFTIRVYFITAATITLLWLFALPGRRSGPALEPVRRPAGCHRTPRVDARPPSEERAVGTTNWRASVPRAGSLVKRLGLGRLAAAIAMLVLSLSMNSVGWFSLKEGMGWIEGAIAMTTEAASGMLREGSMPPLYLATLFVPSLYGALDVHAWGMALKETTTTLSAVNGGVFVMTAVLAAIVALRWESAEGDSRHRRVWTWIGLLVLVGSLLTMMGRFTPVFGWFCAVLPWFFKFPHPVYYRFAACWAVAILAGIGVSALMRMPLNSPIGPGGTGHSIRTNRWFVWLCGGSRSTATALNGPLQSSPEKARARQARATRERAPCSGGQRLPDAGGTTGGALANQPAPGRSGPRGAERAGAGGRGSGGLCSCLAEAVRRRMPSAGPVVGLPWYGRWPVAALCIALAGAGVAAGLCWRVDSLRGYEALSLYREWQWFLTRPVSHLAVASVALLAIFTRLAPRRRGWALAVGVAAETLLLAGYILYVSPVFSQFRRPPDYRAHWVSESGTEQRCRTLADFAPNRVVSVVRPLLDNPSVRVATFMSAVDNQVWATDGRALLGYAAKPLLPRFEKAIEPFVTGQPYCLSLNVVSPAFMRNMNVGYFIGPELQSPRWPVVARLEGAAVYRLDAPLPWVYTQDRIVAADDARQLDVLQRGDLREAVLVAPEVAVRLPASGASDVATFAALQVTNRILRVDRSRPNHLTVEADIARPAMLVIVECWHPGWTATVDGRPVPVWQVNYLQQGLWLEAGRHRVELAFMPESVRRGAAVSGVAGAVFLLAACWGWWRERRRRREHAG